MYTPSYDYLEHHGIDGQKWGRRNGPPYPLDYKSHSAEEKKKNSKSSLSVYDSKQAQKDYNKLKKNRRGFTSDRLAKTKTAKSIYKNNRDEITSLRKQMFKAQKNYKKVYSDELEKRDDGKKHPDTKYELDAWEAENTANRLAGNDLKNAREAYNNRMKELAREAFGDYASMPLNSISGKYSSVENFIADAIEQIDNNENMRDIVLGRSRY